MTETEKRHAGEMYYAMDPDIRRDYLESVGVTTNLPRGRRRSAKHF